MRRPLRRLSCPRPSTLYEITISRPVLCIVRSDGRLMLFPTESPDGEESGRTSSVGAMMSFFSSSSGCGKLRMGRDLDWGTALQTAIAPDLKPLASPVTMPDRMSWLKMTPHRKFNMSLGALTASPNAVDTYLGGGDKGELEAGNNAGLVMALAAHGGREWRSSGDGEISLPALSSSALDVLNDVIVDGTQTWGAVGAISLTHHLAGLYRHTTGAPKGATAGLGTAGQTKSSVGRRAGDTIFEVLSRTRTAEAQAARKAAPWWDRILKMVDLVAPVLPFGGIASAVVALADMDFEPANFSASLGRDASVDDMDAILAEALGRFR